jgi:hypothetical protein
METWSIIPRGMQWVLAAEGENRTLCIFTSRGAALSRCRHLAGRRPHCITIFQEDGTIDEVILEEAGV